MLKKLSEHSRAVQLGCEDKQDTGRIISAVEKLNDAKWLDEEIALPVSKLCFSGKIWKEKNKKGG